MYSYFIGRLQLATRYAHLIHDSYYVFALNGEDVTIFTPAEITAKVGREAAPWSFICVRADLPKRIGYDAISAEQLREQNSKTFLAAARCGDDEALSAAIESGQDTSVTNAIGWGAVHFSAANNHLLILNRMLKERGKSCLAALDVSGQTALHVASSRGHIGVVNLLLRRGIFFLFLQTFFFFFPNFIFYMYITIFFQLIGAPRVDDVEVMLLLFCLFFSSSPFLSPRLTTAPFFFFFFTHTTHTTQQGRNALHLACQYGHADVVKSLLDAGYDPCRGDGTWQWPGSFFFSHFYSNASAQFFLFFLFCFFFFFFFPPL